MVSCMATWLGLVLSHLVNNSCCKGINVKAIFNRDEIYIRRILSRLPL